LGTTLARNKADVDNMLAGFEDFFHGEILGQKKYLRDLSKGKSKKKLELVAVSFGESRGDYFWMNPLPFRYPTTQLAKGNYKGFGRQ